MTVWFWDGNLFSAVILLGAVAFLAFLLLAGWRLVNQRALDRDEIQMRRASQRWQALDLQREDRREIASPLPPADDDDG